jgi:hypothetical protein
MTTQGKWTRQKLSPLELASDPRTWDKVRNQVNKVLVATCQRATGYRLALTTRFSTEGRRFDVWNPEFHGAEHLVGEPLFGSTCLHGYAASF